MNLMEFQGPTFTMQVPTDWYITSSQQFQAVFLGPVSEDGVRPNLSVAMRPVQPDVSAGDVALQVRQAQAAQYSGYEVLGEVDYSESGGLGYVRRYRWYNHDRAADLLQIQAFFVYDSVLYTLTATTLTADSEAWDDAFREMMLSFRFR